MRTLKSSAGLSAVLFVAGLAGSLGGSSPATAGECRHAHGQLSSTFFTAGCTSPVGFCTAGTVSRAGILNGTDVFVATSITPTEVPGIVLYTGILTVTTRGGTLTFATSGTISFVTGRFTETDTITAGTGRFAGATGALLISGVLKPDGSGFLSTIGGQTCVADDENDERDNEGGK